MSRATSILNRISEETGIPVVTVGRVARALREATPPLFIRGGSGPGTGEHANSTQIVNLMLGCCVADPISMSARLVTDYREASFSPPIEDIFDKNDKPSEPMMKGSTLGERMDTIVEDLTLPNREVLRAQLADGEFSITMVVGNASLAWVRWYGKEDIYDARPAPSQGAKLPPGWLLRTVKLTLVHFEIMAELWADTKAQKAPSTNSILDLPNDGSGNESAASDLAKGQNAAALSDQPALTELDGGLQPHSAGVREKTQSASNSRAGRSRPSDRSVKYDRHQYDHHAAV